MNVDEIRRSFEFINTVKSVHQFHVWGISDGETAIMIHIVTTGIDDSQVYKEAVKICSKNKFKYFTVQIENASKGLFCPIQTIH